MFYVVQINSIGTMTNYHNEFIALVNRVYSVSLDAFLDYYIGGL